MALKRKWALKWVMLSVPILVKLEFFQHPREDVIEVVVCTTAVIIISVQFSELEYFQHFISFFFSKNYFLHAGCDTTLSGIFLVLNQSMSVKIIFIYSNENDGFNIKIIIFWSKKPQQIWRRKKLTSVCFRISKRFQQNSTLQKTSGGGKDYTDTKNDQRTLALQM